MTENERIAGFVRAMWNWYERHKRTLPWRDLAIEDATERAYRVLVSEVMLQQTQVSRVIIVFKDFLKKFSSLQSLASATNAEVIMAWRGMGYNSRALRLRDVAQSVVQQYNGVFPQDYESIRTMKGLGPYTAAAICNFAFNMPTPCIDTNIRRILHRTFAGPENPDGTWPVHDRQLLVHAQNALHAAVHDGIPLHDARNWHAALMDYGSLVQTKNNPKWEVCVLTQQGIMRTTPENWTPPIRGAATERLKREPGRLVGSTYVPNRIFRGKIVEALRDAHAPLSTEEIGRQVCIDWNAAHREWLNGLLKKLVKDTLIARRANGYALAK